jgi:tRNA (cmo5U34)-methyltransferase
MSVNQWTDAEHSQAYLRRAAAIPHRGEGEQALLELVPPAPTRVLDLGTGGGRLIDLVRSVRPGVPVVGVDFSPTMLEAVRERYADDATVEIVEHDLDRPLPQLGSFDPVVSSFAIHHLDDERKQALYAEVYEMLTPGSVFANLEHVASPTPELHDAFLHAMGTKPEDDDPSNKLALVEIQLEWLREIGFTQVDCFWKWRELALFAGTKPK